MAISLDDRGFNYGDGLFETMAVVGGDISLLDYHFARLKRGLAALKINICIETLRPQVMNELKLPQATGDNYILKLIVTRGVGGRGYAFDNNLPGCVYFRHCPWPNYPVKNSQQGVITRLCQLRLAQQPALAGIKHLNRLEQVLARQEWQDSEIAEGLLLDSAGNLIEGVSSNIFLVKGKTLLTPKLDQCGVAGVMRAYLIQLAQQFDLQVAEVQLQLEQVRQADEVFICNSVIGIWPVIKIINCCDKCVGQVTKALQYALAKRLGWVISGSR